MPAIKPDKYIRVDHIEKELHYYEDDGSQSCDIGQMLIDFLYLDFTKYEKSRLEIISTLNHPHKFLSAIEDNRDKYKAMRTPDKVDSHKYPHEVIMRNLLGLNGDTSDQQVFVINWIYHQIENLKKVHPYFSIMDIGVLGATNYEDLLDMNFNLEELQTIFDDAFRFCLLREHDSILNGLDPIKKLYIYNQQNKSSAHFRQFSFEKYNINAKILYDPYTDSNAGRSKRTLAQWVDFVNDKDFTLMEHYYVHDIASLLYSEFFQMVKLNMQAGICQNCNKLFALKDLYYSKYCNRPIGDDKGRTCKSIGAVTKFKQTLDKDPVYNIYRRVYNRLHTRKRQNTITSETLAQLKEKITELRKDVKQGRITFEDYETQMEDM